MSVAAQTSCHITATTTLENDVHQQKPSILGLADTHEDCGTLLLLMFGGSTRG